MNSGGIYSLGSIKSDTLPQLFAEKIKKRIAARCVVYVIEHPKRKKVAPIWCDLFCNFANLLLATTGFELKSIVYAHVIHPANKKSDYCAFLI